MSYGTDEPTTPAGYLGSRPTSHTSTPAFPVSPPPGQQYGPATYGTPQPRGPQEYSTGQFAPQGFPPPPPRKKKRGRGLELAAVGVVVLIALGIGAAWAIANRSATPVASPTASPRPANVSCEHGQLPNGACAGQADPGKVYATPAASDFKLSLKILKKECFGSAGCNVGIRVEMQYIGKPAEPSSLWDVTYDITGAEDPYTATMTVTFDGGGQPAEYTQDDGEMVQTKKSSATLAITATDVSKH